MHKGEHPLGTYDVQVEETNGKPVVRARSVHAGSGMKITLTFPVGAGADLAQFKERVVRSHLERHK